MSLNLVNGWSSNNDNIYRARVQDAPQEMVRNKDAAMQSEVWPSTQLLLTLPLFPVGHPAHERGIISEYLSQIKQQFC